MTLNKNLLDGGIPPCYDFFKFQVGNRGILWEQMLDR